MKKLLSATLLVFLGSCTFFTENFDDKPYEVVGLKQSTLNIAFSHNINGETHPCGCRHFPLGGLPQIAGAMHEMKKDADFLYVDTGDTFFPSSTVPKTLEKSLTFAAENLAKGLDDLGLKYFVPGDQDFALGWDFLNKISKTRKFQFLISNLKKKERIKHKEWVIFEKGPHKFFLAGVVDPRILPTSVKGDFLDTKTALENTLKTFKDKGYDEKNKFHRILIFSHSGFDYDEELAKKFKNIDWIVGAHSQSFLRFPRDYGNVKLVQVLSRNHYLGQVSLSLKNDKSKDDYKIIEIRDELKDKLKPNPWMAFIDKHKETLSKIRTEEQGGLASDYSDVPLQTTNSCLECHEQQTAHYDKTPHALAYYTLVKDKEQNNLACVKCHSVGLNDPRGFKKASDIIIIDKEVKEQDKAKEKYWAEVMLAMKPIKSVRSLKPKQIAKYSKAWRDLDLKHKVENNFGNVQCLNCHSRHPEHPFEPEGHIYLEGDKAKDEMRSSCLDCHDPDQSPAWYLKDEKGLPSKPNYELLDKKIQMIGCPKTE